MHLRMRVCLAACLTVPVLLATPAGARTKAGKRVVLMGVVGAPQAEKELAKFLRGSVQVLGQKDYVRVATQLGATGTDPKDVVKVATKLRAAVIIAGKLGREGRGYALRLVLREGASGRVVAKLRYPLARPVLDSSTERQLKQDIMPVIAEAVAPGGGAGATEIDLAEVARGGNEAGDGDDENPLASARAKPARERVATAEPARGGQVSDRAPEPTEARPVWRTLVEAGAGLAFTDRTYSTSNSSEPTYSSGQIPGVRLDAVVYPAASLGKLGAAFGIDARYERMAGFNSSSTRMNVTAPTFEDAFTIGVRGRWIIREAADSPVLIARLGFGERRFAIQGDNNLGIPEVDYQFADIGAGARVPLGTPKLALAAAVAFQAVTGAGPIADMNNYGAATIGGFRADAGLEVLPIEWLSLRAGLALSYFWFTFTGGGARSADSASDRYLGGHLGAAVLY